jgi:hypothetical protein
MPEFDCSPLFWPPRTCLAVGAASFWLFAREGVASEVDHLAKEADVERQSGGRSKELEFTSAKT